MTSIFVNTNVVHIYKQNKGIVLPPPWSLLALKVVGVFPYKNRNRPVSFLVSSGLEGFWRTPQKKVWKVCLYIYI